MSAGEQVRTQRPDLLGLGDDALADLTNRGTLRRALKELDTGAVTCELEVGPSGDVTVEGSDGTRVELLAGRGFGDWTCTCLAASECRHVVRAVVFARRLAEAGEGADATGAAGSADGTDAAGSVDLAGSADGTDAAGSVDLAGSADGTGTPGTTAGDSSGDGTAGTAPSGTAGGKGAVGSSGADPGTRPQDPSDSPTAGGSPATDGTSNASAPEPFWPGDVTDETIVAVLRPQALTRAKRQAEGGLLGVVTPSVPRGRTTGVAVVRLVHPEQVTVRFLLGGDLGFVRCDCTLADPCAHVPLAVLLARGEHVQGWDSQTAGAAEPGERPSGLYSTPGATWRPDPQTLSDALALLTDAVRVGVDSSRHGLSAPLRRMVAQLRERGLLHPATALDDLIEETGRFAVGDARFSPDGLLALTAEVGARLRALRASAPPVPTASAAPGEQEPDANAAPSTPGPSGTEQSAPGRVPPPLLVAGSERTPVTTGWGRYVGLGTELVERADRCLVRAVAVDVRSGAPIQVSRWRDEDPSSPRSAADLAAVRVGGVELARWGGGQVMSERGKRTAAGELTTGRKGVNVSESGDLSELGAPHALQSFTELAVQGSHLPAVLDDRTVGVGLAACRVAGVVGAHFDDVDQAVRATLVDADGRTALLRMPYSTRQRHGCAALLDWLAESAGEEGEGAQSADPPSTDDATAEHASDDSATAGAPGSDAGGGHLPELWVAGRWSWRDGTPIVHPTLVRRVGRDAKGARAVRSVQPQVHGRAATPLDQERLGSGSESEAATPSRALRQLLGEAMIGGTDRVLRDRGEEVEQVARAFSAQGLRATAARIRDLSALDGDARAESLIDLVIALEVGAI